MPTNRVVVALISDDAKISQLSLGRKLEKYLKIVKGQGTGGRVEGREVEAE